MLIYISGSEQVTSTTVPGSTGNCVVVSNLLLHSVGSSLQASPRVKTKLFLHHFTKTQNLFNCNNEEIY